MANLTITPAAIIAASTATIRTGTAGETITAGMPLYLKSSDLRHWKAANGSTQEAARVAGISLHAASAGQPIAFITAGSLTVGAILTRGVTYSLSSTAGLICQYGDIVHGDITATYISLLGVASSTSVLAVGIVNN